MARVHTESNGIFQVEGELVEEKRGIKVEQITTPIDKSKVLGQRSVLKGRQKSRNVKSERISFCAVRDHKALTSGKLTNGKGTGI
jgi:hypothetical protein